MALINISKGWVDKVRGVNIRKVIHNRLPLWGASTLTYEAKIADLESENAKLRKRLQQYRETTGQRQRRQATADGRDRLLLVMSEINAPKFFDTLAERADLSSCEVRGYLGELLEKGYINREPAIEMGRSTRPETFSITYSGRQYVMENLS